MPSIPGAGTLHTDADNVIQRVVGRVPDRRKHLDLSGVFGNGADRGQTTILFGYNALDIRRQVACDTSLDIGLANSCQRFLKTRKRT